MATDVLSWSDLRGKQVTQVDQGRDQYGIIEDFYYDTETRAIYALRVNARLAGYRVLLSSAIRSIGREGATVVNANMIIPEDNAGPVYQFPRGSQLIGFEVLSEQGERLGVVRNIILGIYPPVALRIAAIDLGGGVRISASEITRFSEGKLSIIEQAARTLS